MPNLKDLPSLRNLNLSKNKLTGIKFILSEQNLITIEKIDLSHNLIWFKDKEGVNELSERLKKFRKLNNFSIN